MLLARFTRSYLQAVCLVGKIHYSCQELEFLGWRNQDFVI